MAAPLIGWTDPIANSSDATLWRVGLVMRKPPKLKQPRLAAVLPGQICHSPEQIAEALGVAMSTLWLILKSGELKSFKAGRSRRITSDALRDYQNRIAI